jgi:hypothetical protein
MNYQQIYDNLITRARGRNVTSYTEHHHILPKCLGGTDSDDNLVALTPEEHYVAHQLLCKLYPLSGNLAYAMLLMTATGTKNPRSNKAYGWVRRRASVTRVGKKRVLSDDARRRMSEASKKRAGIPRKPHSDATKEKMSLAHTGKKRSEQFRETMRNIALSDKRTPPS